MKEITNKIPKLLIPLLFLFVLFQGAAGHAAVNDPILLFQDRSFAMINQKKMKLDSDGRIHVVTKNGRTLVPARFIAEQLGASVHWDPPTQTVTIKSDGKEIQLEAAKAQMRVNDMVLELDVPAEIRYGRVFLPLRSLSEALGREVVYDKGLIVISQQSPDLSQLATWHEQYRALEPIEIIFAGDTLFDGSVRTAVRKNGPDYPFVYVKDKVMKADYAILNLETSVTNRGTKDTVQLYNFRADPVSLKGVKNAGFDMVSLANNHALDYGQTGFLDTLKHVREQGLKKIGAGMNANEAYKAETAQIKGKKIKFLAFSRFLPSTEWYAQNKRPGIASAYQEQPVIEAIKRGKRMLIFSSSISIGE